MGQVADNIWKLNALVRGIGQNRQQHQRLTSELGLRKAIIDRDTRIAEQKRIKQERDNKVVTGRQAIMMSTMPDAAKQTFITRIEQSFPKKAGQLLDGDTYKYGEWSSAFRQSVENVRKANVAKTESDRAYQLGLRRTKAAEITAQAAKTRAEKAGASGKHKMAQDVDLLRDVYGITRKEAMDMYRKDKNLGERIRLYTNELDRLADDDTFKYDLTEEQKAQKIKELRSAYRISDVMPDQEQPGDAGDDQIFSELGRQFPDAAEGTKKYLGNREFTKQDGKWIETQQLKSAH